MKKLTIFENEEIADEIYVTEDTTNITALGNWLEDYEGKFEMIETIDDGNPYAEIGNDYFEIKEG